MGKIKKKYESGAATAFIARNQAIKKLQLTIADFRRLCILKGVYPVEPKHKKKVNKGSTANRTFYYVKDINYLANEPIVRKFRDFKVYVKRLKRAKGRRDIKGIARIRNNKPAYKLDHIVKERYPSYTDAVRDLDDCLSLIFLFSILPKSKRVYVERVHLAQRLSLEFMHYIIASKSLRKCFISIKGYYFQAEIKGQKVTWIMPHKLAYQNPDDVDFRIMSTFVEFYSIMLGFVNYKSYLDIGLIYPPKLSISTETIKETEKSKLDKNDFNDEFLASLNCDFIKISESPDAALNGDEFPLADEENPAIIEQAKLEEENLNKLKNLFKGMKFFLNREIPREQFVFAVRSFSGQVSWDQTLALGATYQESDETITHQVVDRPMPPGAKTYMNRVYVQPQWIFDCINENMVLPHEEYLPGAILPPHLSPFVDHADGSYVPPEKQRLIKLKLGITPEESIIKPTAIETVKKVEKPKTDSNGSQKSDKVTKKELIKDIKKVEEEDDEENDFDGMKVDLDTPDEEESEEEEEELDSGEEEENLKKKTEKPMIAVVKGKAKEENVHMALKKQIDEDKKLSEMMIPKKHKRLYSKIMYSQKKQRQETEKLKEKRQIYEENKTKPKQKQR